MRCVEAKNCQYQYKRAMALLKLCNLETWNYLCGWLCEAGNFSTAGSTATAGCCEGLVVIALSGFSKWSWFGPSPILINARESGTVLFCQPLSA